MDQKYEIGTRIFDDNRWLWGEIISFENGNYQIKSGEYSESLTEEEVEHRLSKKYTCFGCFITPNDNWFQYVDSNDIFDENGRIIGKKDPKKQPLWTKYI